MKRPPTPQTPCERLIPGNTRIIAPSGKTTWRIKCSNVQVVGERPKLVISPTGS